MNAGESRRNFIKLSSLGLSSFVLPTAAKRTKKAAILSIAKAGSGSQLNIVCIGAHPGDPEFGCGGTMSRYSTAGHKVTFLYLTRGEAGDPAKSYDESASLRTKEAEAACKALHVTARFVGQIDGNTVLSNEKNAEMLKILDAEKPDLVFSHWPLDSHVDHQITGLLTLSSWIKMEKRFDLYFYEVNTGSETMAFTPTDYVDISDVQDQKKVAMYAHKTQDPVNTYNTYFKKMEDFRGLEAGVKAAEAFIHFKSNKAKAAIIGS